MSPSLVVRPHFHPPSSEILPAIRERKNIDSDGEFEGGSWFWGVRQRRWMKGCDTDNEVDVYVHGHLNAEPLILCFLFSSPSECCPMMFNGSSDPDA